MFAEIVQVLELDRATFRFEDSSLDRIDIFASPGPADMRRVFIDQRYPLWLLERNLITGIWATVAFSGEHE